MGPCGQHHLGSHWPTIWMGYGSGQCHYVLVAGPSRLVATKSAFRLVMSPYVAKESTNTSVAATVRDTVYIDGGYLYWVPGMADGSYGPPTEDSE
jgi:hypothetical protein